MWKLFGREFTKCIKPNFPRYRNYLHKRWLDRSFRSDTEIYSKKDLRVIIINQSNQGQSAARNVGIKTAHGKYIYFMDSDDKLERNAIETLYWEAEKEKLDLLLFDGTSFYETSELEKKFPQYKTYYKRTYRYKKVRLGCDLYVEMVRNGDFKVSPCLQFFNRDFC